MLTSYQRRAFLLLAIAGIEPGLTPAVLAQDALTGTASPAPSQAPVQTGNPSVGPSVSDILKPAGPTRAALAPSPTPGVTPTVVPAKGGSPGKPTRGTTVPKPGAKTAPNAPATPTINLPDTGLSLWEALGHVERGNLTGREIAPTNQEPTRIALGPVPGFTLPASLRRVASDGSGGDWSTGRRKKKKSGMFGALGDWFDHIQQATGTKIKASGHHTTSIRMDSVSGGSSAQQAFTDSQYIGRGSGGIYNDTDLNIDATLFKYFHYATSFSNRQYGNANNNRVKFDYNTPKMRVEYGDFNAHFAGNSLIDFSRYLNGIQMTNQVTKQIKTTVLYSQTKAETRTIVIAGNNSAGPYYLYAGQIVDGSDRVRIDNHELRKGDDYTLDNTTGELQFKPGNIVLNSQSIAVTFETLGYNQTKGSIYGMRSDLALRPGMSLGVTYVTQTARGSGLPTQRTEQVPVYGNDQFFEVSTPIDGTKPVTVLVDGIPYPVNAEFRLDTQSPNRIRVFRTIPPAAHVEVQYTPLSTDVTPGNRSVMGLDGKLGLGRWGTLTGELATSGLSLTGQTIQGRAAQIKADLTPFKGMHTSLSLRDINPAFSSIQSPGFNRNEKAVELNGDYTPFSKLHLNFNWLKAKRPSYASSNGSYVVSSTGNDTYDQYGLGATYNILKNASISLNRTSYATQYIQGGHTQNLSDNVSLNYTLGRASFEAGVSHITSNTISIYTGTSLASTSTSATAATATLSKHVGVNWQAAKWLSLAGTVSDNNISNVNTTSSKTNARDMSFSARMTPLKNVRFGYAYSLTDTGNTGTLSNGVTTFVPGTTSTGTTGTGTGTSGTTNGTATTGGTTTSNGRAAQTLFAPWVNLPATRDTTTGVNTSTGATFGGGANAGLGSTGSYGAGLVSGNNYNYGATVYGGKSSSNRFDMEFQPRRDMQVQMLFDIASSLGDYQYNSNRSNAQLNWSWQPSDRFQFTLGYGVQRTAYTNGYGNANTGSINFAMTGHPLGGKLGTSLSWTSLNTKSLLALSSGGTTTGTALTKTDTSSNQSSLAARLDYPVSSRYTLFTDLLSSSTVGYSGGTQSDLRFGVDINLTQAFKFSLGWQVQSRYNKDAAQINYNYRSSSLLAEFGLHF